MLENLTHHTDRGRRFLKTLILAAGSVAVLGATSMTPAKAWYDAYGYWHPNYRHHYYDRRYAYRSSYEWRHHRWCERHPGACRDPYWRR